MDKELRILILEDLPGDAELMVRELRKSHLGFSSKRVETQEDFLQQLAGFVPDLILADYKLPRFDGVTALKLARKITPFTPVIIVTGSLNEEVAVDYMKAGAADYVLKESLTRLGPAVKGALQKKQIQEEKRRAEDALRRNEQQYRLLVERVADGIGIVQKGKFVFINDALAAMFGFTPAQLVGKTPLDFFRFDDMTVFRKIDTAFEQKSVEAQSQPILQCMISADQRETWMEGYQSVISWEGKPAILVNLHDITKRKLREMKIEEERKRLHTENIQLRSNIKERYRFGKIIGKSPIMQGLYELILKTSASAKDVLIMGESGTGKELIAKTIHQLSKRQGNAFVPVNCGAIPETLFESEFFGHQKGAFTGADRNKQGLLQTAHNGTLFLDEVGELAPLMQVKLLRALEEREYTPLGENTPRKMNVRIIAATNRDITEQVEKGMMREDFFYRIHIIVLTVPPLRERREDIPLLIDYFVQEYGNDDNLAPISGRLLETFYNHAWPGNVRQLRNVLSRYITVGHLDFSGPRSAAVESVEIDADSDREFDQDDVTLQETLEHVEKRVIARALERHHWNRTETASQLGIETRTLRRKIKKYHLL